MKNLNIKLYISTFLASVAATGNIPYGYRFAFSVFPLNEPYINILGYIFAAAATLANIALGTYSLLSIKKIDLFGPKHYTVLLSIIGCIPIGFICFLGYLNSLPIVLNICLSFIVALVNAGIGLRAILNVVDTFSNIKKSFGNYLNEIILRITGFTIGIAVSTVGYVAATSSLIMLFTHFHIKQSTAESLSYSIAIFTWLPFAALFANSTQQVIGDLYEFYTLKKSTQSKSNNHYLFISIGVLSILSASSIVQMVFELFTPNSQIPEIFKYDFMQTFIKKILAPLAFFSSAAVNLFALKNLQKFMKS